ncbi:hypothetical protein KKC32_03075 [Patescibacteria group bacterium]|nr:hypothetical protein [Patescibacteria group bacterium]
MEKILQHFHHIHHEENNHRVHHCGGAHPSVDYEICHCACGLHRIDKKIAIGHNFDESEVEFEFFEECVCGGWHVESGKEKISNKR